MNERDDSSPPPGTLETALGWQRPTMHGIGWIVQAYVGDDADGEPILEDLPGEVTFTRISAGSGYAAAAAIATVVEHRGGSASYPLSREELDKAIDLLDDAAESGDADTTGTDASDLEVWREMQDAEDGEAIYVFVGDRARRSGDPYVHRLIEVADSGRQDVTYGESRWWPAEDAVNDPYPLIAAWAEAWVGALPIAHELKELFEEVWVRFHSLPGSKRYADSPEETAEILARHNAVIGELAGVVGGGIIVIAAEVASTPAPTAAPAFDDLLPAESFWAAVPWHYADPDLLFAHLYVSRFAWAPGVLDELLGAVADGDLAGVIVAPADLGWLYHPYDGGADVVLPSVAERDALAARHPQWRSNHPSGL